MEYLTAEIFGKVGEDIVDVVYMFTFVGSFFYNLIVRSGILFILSLAGLLGLFLKQFCRVDNCLYDLVNKLLDFTDFICRRKVQVDPEKLAILPEAGENKSKTKKQRKAKENRKKHENKAQSVVSKMMNAKAGKRTPRNEIVYSSDEEVFFSNPTNEYTASAALEAFCAGGDVASRFFAAKVPSFMATLDLSRRTAPGQLERNVPRVCDVYKQADNTDGPPTHVWMLCPPTPHPSGLDVNSRALIAAFDQNHESVRILHNTWIDKDAIPDARDRKTLSTLATFLTKNAEQGSKPFHNNTYDIPIEQRQFWIRHFYCMSNLEATPDLLVDLVSNLKQFGPIETQDAKDFAEILAARILTATQANWTSAHIARAMLGFRAAYSSNRPDSLCDFPHLMALVDVVHAKMRTVQDPFSAAELSAMCYGMQNFDSNRKDIETMVATVTELVQTCDDILSAQQFGNICYGFKNMHATSEVVLNYINVLCDRFERVTEPLCAQHMGNACYGLRGLRNKCPEVERLIGIVARKIANSNDCLNGQLLGNSLYGMKSMCMSPSARALLAALAGKVPSMTGLINSQGVGNALYGLKNMSSDVPECRALVGALAPMIAASHGTLTAQEVSNAIYGMQHMSSIHHEVRLLLKALVPRIKTCNEPFRSQHVGNCMYGLRNMSSDCVEVCEVYDIFEAHKNVYLDALCPYFKNCNQQLKPQEIGNAFYGFRKMSSKKPEVLRLLEVINQLAADADHSVCMSSQEIANAFYGLNGMDGEHVIIRKILTTLAKWCAQSPSVFNAQEVGNSIYGLRGVRLCPELRAAFSALTPKVGRCNAQLQARNISNAFRGFFKLTFDAPEVWGMFRALSLHFGNMIGTLDSMSVGNVLLGLRGCDPQRMGSFLNDFCTAISGTSEKLRASDLANAVYGIVCMITNAQTKHGRNFDARIMFKLLDVCRIKAENSFPTNEKVTTALASLWRSFDNISLLMNVKRMHDPSILAMKSMLENMIRHFDPDNTFKREPCRPRLFTPPGPYRDNEAENSEMFNRDYMKTPGPSPSNLMPGSPKELYPRDATIARLRRTSPIDTNDWGALRTVSASSLQLKQRHSENSNPPNRPQEQQADRSASNGHQSNNIKNTNATTNTNKNENKNENQSKSTNTSKSIAPISNTKKEKEKENDKNDSNKNEKKDIFTTTNKNRRRRGGDNKSKDKDAEKEKKKEEPKKEKEVEEVEAADDDTSPGWRTVPSSNKPRKESKETPKEDDKKEKDKNRRRRGGGARHRGRGKSDDQENKNPNSQNKQASSSGAPN